jgi:3',5'-cyclic AMP phosphodiesterase CpdA
MVANAELMTVGPDEVVVTFVSEPDVEVTTRVGDADVVTTGPHHSARITGLEPDTEYPLDVAGAEPGEYLPDRVRTLRRPPGRLVATIATANDVHFGEVECGRTGDPDADAVGPILRSAPGEPPYPETMNRAVVAEMSELDPDVVVVKGDLTDVGSPEQYAAFLAVYGLLGDRMYHVRGNHDAFTDPEMALEDAPYTVELDGVALAVLDTVVPGQDGGRLTADQLQWLDDLAAESTVPLLVFGHHYVSNVASLDGGPDSFGINRPDSRALIDLFGRRDAVAGYFAGHTHRNRVRRFEPVTRVPCCEVACTKEYPGAWAEYRIHEGGYTQVMRRVTEPAAFAWAERTRDLYAGFYRDYALGPLDSRCFTQLF